jgi:hypothetical protein
VSCEHYQLVRGGRLLRPELLELPRDKFLHTMCPRHIQHLPQRLFCSLLQPLRGGHCKLSARGPQLHPVQRWLLLQRRWRKGLQRLPRWHFFSVILRLLQPSSGSHILHALHCPLLQRSRALRM